MSNKLLKKRYNGHCLYRVIPDPRYLTLLTNGYGTLLADALSGYSGSVVHLTATPDEKYKLKNYDVTGATIEGNDLIFAGEDCTAKANFERYIWDLSLENDGHGSIGASKLTGQSGDIITLSNTPNAGYNFSGYSVTGASLNGSTLTMNNQNATAKAWFSAKPVSSLYYSNTGNYIDKNIKGRTFTINKDITAHRYLTFKFNYMNDNNAGFNVRYNINSLKLSAQDLAFSSYSSAPEYSKPSTYDWPIFYYNSNVDCGKFTRNSAYTYMNYERIGSTGIAICYNIGRADQNYPIKYVIDRNNRNFSAYRNSDFLGNGTLSENANINHVDNFIFTSDIALNYRIMSATNIRLAGFDSWAAATSYNS